MTSRNPFVGPAPIPEGASLYGRDVEKRDLRELLLAERVVLLYSAPGAGKTSLIQASLLPQLRRESRLWVFLIGRLRPAAKSGGTNRYLAALVEQLESTLPAELRGYDLQAEGASLRGCLDRLRGAVPGRDGVVLLLDHFEDVFLDPFDRKEKQAFFAELGSALTDRTRYALFSMGEHHIAELDEYLHLIPTGLTRRYRLGLPGREEALQAIVGPAKDRNVDFAPGAAEELVRKLSATAASESVEPVQLQIVCERLWDACFPPPAEPSGAISLAQVEAVQVEAALQDYYAGQVRAAAAGAGIPERDVRDWVEDRLILPSGGRGQAPWGDTQSGTLPGAATEFLEQGQLVRLEMLGDRRWYELAYSRLVEPIRRDNRRWFEQNLSPLQRKARDWDRSKRPDGLLLSVPEWWKARAWKRARAGELRDEEREYWQRSTRSLRTTRVYPALVVLGMVVAGGWFALEIQRRHAADAALEQQRLLVKLGRAKELALERSLDSALIEGARTAKEVAALAPGKLRERLEFSVRESLMSILRSSRNVRNLIVQEESRLAAVAVQPRRDKALFAYGGAGGKVMLVGVDGDTPVASAAQCAAGFSVRSLAFDPTGEMLALGCTDGTVSVWSTATWELRGRWKAHGGRTLTVAFDSKGTTVASGGEGDNAVKIMPFDRGAPARSEPLALIGKLEPHGAQAKPNPKEQTAIAGGVWTVAFSPADNDMLMVADGVGGLWLCDVGESRCDLKRPGRPDLPGTWNDAVIAAAFSPDGACLATGSWRGQVSLWDARLSAEAPVSLDAAPAFSLVFTKRDGVPNLAIGRATRLNFVPLKQGCRFEAGSARAQGSPLVGDEVTGLAFHAESGLVAAVTAVGYLALIDDVAGPRERIRLPPVHAPVRVEEKSSAYPPEGWRGALASDDGTGSQLVIGGWRGALVDQGDHFAVDPAEEDKLFVVRIEANGRMGIGEPVVAGQGGVDRVTASVARKRVATLGRDDSIRFWKLAATLEPEADMLALDNLLQLVTDASKAQVPALENRRLRAGPTRILLNPGGDVLACLFVGRGRSGVLLIDLADRAKSQWQPIKDVYGGEIAFSPDGSVFAVAYDEVMIWDVEERKLARRNTEAMKMSGLAGNVSELALANSRDGDPVVVAAGGNGQLYLWNARTGAPMPHHQLRADSRQVQQMAFLPGQNLLAAADEYGRVTLWDTGEWQPITITSPADPIRRTRFITFALGGRLLVSGTADLGTWDIDTDSLRAKICSILSARGPAAAGSRVADACDALPPT